MKVFISILLLITSLNLYSKEVYEGENCFLVYKIAVMIEYYRDAGLPLKELHKNINDSKVVDSSLKAFAIKESILIYNLPKKVEYAKSLKKQCVFKNKIERITVSFHNN